VHWGKLWDAGTCSSTYWPIALELEHQSIWQPPTDLTATNMKHQLIRPPLADLAATNMNQELLQKAHISLVKAFDLKNAYVRFFCFELQVNHGFAHRDGA
jgi:hypothetical protein